MKPRQMLLSDDIFDETLDDLSIQLESSSDRLCDDGIIIEKEPPTAQDYQILTETFARIGGEVSKIRSEVDALLEQNAALLEAFQLLKEVMEEKQQLNLDDFQLACDVVESRGKIDNLKP